MSKRLSTNISSGWLFDPNRPVTDDTFGPDWLGWMLKCPRCGEDYLHPAHVTVFPLDGDVQTASLWDGRNVEPPNCCNPAEGRQAVAIGFFCENCDGGSWEQASIELTIALGDGNTFLAWRYLPPEFI